MDFISGATNPRFQPFNSSIEHPKIAEKIQLKDEFRIMTLPNGVEIKFEEIIGLAGDLCGSPENPIIDPFKEEEDFNRKQRFRDAYVTQARAPKDELQKELAGQAVGILQERKSP